METKSIGRGPQVRDVSTTATNKSALDGVSDPANSSQSLQKNNAESVNVSLSPEAKVLAEAKKKALGIAMNTPDVREDRVAELKRKISAGEYQIDSEKIADGILREALREQLATVPE